MAPGPGPERGRGSSLLETQVGPATRPSSPDWPAREVPIDLDTAHDPILSAPDTLAAILERCARDGAGERP